VEGGALLLAESQSWHEILYPTIRLRGWQWLSAKTGGYRLFVTHLHHWLILPGQLLPHLLARMAAVPPPAHQNGPPHLHYHLAVLSVREFCSVRLSASGSQLHLTLLGLSKLAGEFVCSLAPWLRRRFCAIPGEDAIFKNGKMALHCPYEKVFFSFHKNLECSCA